LTLTVTATATLTKPSRTAADIRCMLSFQRLDVYQRAIEFVALAWSTRFHVVTPTAPTS
jgi:hypothetical protein